MKKPKKISRFTNVKVVLYGFALWFWVSIAIILITDGAVSQGLILGGIGGALLLWRFLVNLKRYRSPEYREMQEQARRDYAAYKAAAPARKAEQKEKSARARQMKEDSRKPIAAVLISTQDRYGKSVIGTAARTALGGALFGVFGAAVGMSTARSEVVAQKATFSVRYKNGSTGTETVDVGSKRFKELAALLVK